MGHPHPPGAFCPACERFIGPADACPYCDADSAKSPALRYLRYAALALAVTGLLLLYRSSGHTGVPRSRISELTPMMNFARVRVSGRILKDPLIIRRQGKIDYASFLVDDGSGIAQVVAYRNLARRFEDGLRLPARQMEADITGRLRIDGDGRARVYPDTPEQIRLSFDEPNETALHPMTPPEDTQRSDP
jgi:hypothetical protein